MGQGGFSNGLNKHLQLSTMEILYDLNEILWKLENISVVDENFATGFVSNA